MKPAVRSFLLFLVGWVPACVLLFLLLSGFFSSWSGKVVSVRGVQEEQPVFQVLIASPDGSTFEQNWPAEAVQGLDLAIDRLGLPPSPLPKDLADTRKQRFALTYTITPAGGTTMDHSMATPQTLALALLALFGGALLRNMIVAGNPLSLEPRGVERVKAQAAPGSVTPNKKGAKSRGPRGRKGPPPAKRRRGTGRRR